MYIYTYRYIHIYLYLYTYIHIYIYTYIHIHIDTSTHIYIFTHIHIYIYSYIHSLPPSPLPPSASLFPPLTSATWNMMNYKAWRQTARDRPVAYDRPRSMGCDVLVYVPLPTGIRQSTDKSKVSRPRGCEVEVIEGTLGMLKTHRAANGTYNNEFIA